MALKQRNKISISFSMASMTDIIFLLLIFFMITSTLISPNALRLLLPESNNQASEKVATTISISSDLQYYVNIDGKTTKVLFNEIEGTLIKTLGNSEEPFISLHADKSVPIEEIVKIMNIARKNRYKLLLATVPEK